MTYRSNWHGSVSHVFSLVCVWDVCSLILFHKQEGKAIKKLAHHMDESVKRVEKAAAQMSPPPTRKQEEIWVSAILVELFAA